MSKKLTHDEFANKLKNINNNVKILGVYINSSTKITVCCLKDGYIWDAYPRNLLRGIGCPVCDNKIIVKGINDMWDTNPELAKLLADPNDGYKYTQHSNKFVNWKCPNCGNIVKRMINQISTERISCPKCGDGVSYPEKFMYNLLKQLNIDFEYQYTPEWIKPKRFDFYINIYNIIIEMDGGIGHGNMNNVDIEKDDLAIKHNIVVYRINCDYKDYKSRFDFIKNNIINSILNKYINFLNVNWLDIQNNCSNSFIKIVCDMWNNQIYNTDFIAHTVKMSRGTVINYLKIGSKINLCNYNVGLGRKLSRTNSVSVICINTDITYCSSNEAMRQTGIKNSAILDCCKGKNLYAGVDNNNFPMIWRFANNKYDNSKIIQDVTKLINEKNGYKTKIICTTTNEIFDSVSSAKKKYKALGIWKCLNGHSKTSGTNPITGEKLKWEYLAQSERR